jgi:hypothetical protein
MRDGVDAIHPMSGSRSAKTPRDRDRRHRQEERRRMVQTVGMLVAVLVGIGVVDRFLLAAEAKGWINYRRRGLSMGAAGYHAGQLASMITPGVGHLHDAAVEEVQEEDDRGAPPPPIGS